MKRTSKPTLVTSSFESADPPAQVTSTDWDTASETLPADFNSRLRAVPKDKSSSKPDISSLADAIGPDGTPIFCKGDKIVIERYASILPGAPYMDTRTYVVNSIDMETGKVMLWDDSLMQHGTDNWKVGLKNGQVYKFAGLLNLSSKKKRGRPRKNPTAPPAPPPPTDANGQPIKKKRGRPAGVKNRPKAIIAAEKKEKVALRKAKLQARKAKKKQAETKATKKRSK